MLFYLILAILVSQFMLERFLAWLNKENWPKSIPNEFKEVIDQEKFDKSKSYFQANSKFGLISSLFSLILILIMLWFEGFAKLDQTLRQYIINPYGLTIAYFSILFLASDIIQTPFSWYHHFVKEAKFGFNKMTLKTFITDKLKGYLLSALLGIPLFLLILWFYFQFPKNFWWLSWLLVSGFSIFMAMFYADLIVPLFNKLKPMESGSLKDQIIEYANKINFPIKKINILDGSKRSSKANAFFSGLGKQKNIVLFDTLIEEQTEEEIVAVLAHEVGHYKRNHIYKNIILSVLQTGLLFFILGYFLKNPLLSQILGVDQPSFHISLIAFSLLFSPFSMIIGLGFNYLSRKYEYEADDYARQTYGSNPLKSALKKLSINHLSHLTPHPAFIFFYYSHPSLIQRLKALSN